MKHLRLAEIERIEALRQAVATVRRGGIVLYPTDTIYGLGCDPFCDRAVKKLTHLKRRLDSQPYLVLVYRPEAVTQLASRVPGLFAFFSERLWPGPITMIFEKERNKKPFVGNDSIGIRCPRWSFLRDFLRMLGAPLISTSVNRSGETPIRDPEDAARQFSEGIDLFLDFGKLLHNHPSTIVDLRYDPPRILREGAMLQRVQDAIREWQVVQRTMVAAMSRRKGDTAAR